MRLLARATADALLIAVARVARRNRRIRRPPAPQRRLGRLRAARRKCRISRRLPADAGRSRSGSMPNPIWQAYPPTVDASGPGRDARWHCRPVAANRHELVPADPVYPVTTEPSLRRIADPARTPATASFKRPSSPPRGCRSSITINLGWTDLRTEVVTALPFFTRENPIIITPSYELHFLESAGRHLICRRGCTMWRSTSTSSACTTITGSPTSPSRPVCMPTTTASTPARRCGSTAGPSACMRRRSI